MQQVLIHQILLKNLVTVPVDLSKLSKVVKNDVVKKDVYNAKINNIEDKTPDVTNLATNTTLNAKINEHCMKSVQIRSFFWSVTSYLDTFHAVEVKDKTPAITNLATNAALNAKINEVKNKIPNITNLASTAALTYC